MKKLLSTHQTIKPKQDRKHNQINGNNAECLVAGQLLLCLQGEVSWGSRNEDGRKIDLFMSFDHPWIKKERILLLTQVKSGKEYGNISKDTNGLINGFILNKKTIETNFKNSHDLMIVWVDRNTNKLFWAYIHRNTMIENTLYGNHHEISPAMLYDLARVIGKQTSNIFGGRGITIGALNSNLKENRRKAKTIYRNLAENEIISPVLGKIEFTRLGWRHMFRITRKKKHKEISLQTIFQIENILKQSPSSHKIIDYNQIEEDNYIYRQITHILIYSKVMLSTKNKVEVKVKLKEETSYPINWSNDALLFQKIRRRVVFINSYITDDSIESNSTL